MKDSGMSTPATLLDFWFGAELETTVEMLRDTGWLT